MGSLAVICGDDRFAVKERTCQLAAKLGGEQFADDPGVEIIGCADESSAACEAAAAEFLESLRTPPFLTPQKIVILKDFPSLDPFNSAEHGIYAVLAEMLTAPLPDYLTVVVSAYGADMRTAFAKRLKAVSEFELFNSAKITDKNYAADRRGAIAEICARLQVSPDRNAVDYLVETIAPDSGMLANELAKLACYVGESGRITLDDCRAVCSRTPEAVSWELTEAISSRNTARALKLLNVLLEQGEPEMRLMALLSNEFSRQLGTLAAMRELGIDRVSPRTFDNIAPELKEQFPDNPLLKMHPFRAYKVCESAMKFSPRELARNLTLARDANLALVSSACDRRMVLEQLILGICR